MNEILLSLIVPSCIMFACFGSAVIGAWFYHCGRSNRMPLPSLPKMASAQDKKEILERAANLPKVMP